MPVRYSKDSAGPQTRQGQATNPHFSDNGYPYEAIYPEDLYATAAAEQLAMELRIDLTQIKGTGRQGRITVVDVRKAAGD